MINVFEEELLTMTEAAKVCPKVHGKKPSTVTIWRWATKGKRGVKLESVWIGRNLLTTRTALNTFFNQDLAPAVVRAPQVNWPRNSSDHQRARAVADAKKRLIARGMLPKETEY